MKVTEMKRISLFLKKQLFFYKAWS